MISGCMVGDLSVFQIGYDLGYACTVIVPRVVWVSTADVRLRKYNSTWIRGHHERTAV